MSEVQWGTTPRLGLVQRSAVPTRNHAVDLTGLDAERFYYYRVLVEGRPVSAIIKTRTLPAIGSPDLTFFVVGDSGARTADRDRMAQVLGSWTFDFGLMVGDLVYPHGERENYDSRFFQPLSGTLRTTATFPVAGNHDVETQFGAPFYEAFHLPTRASGTERWFSFDAANSHFVGLDSNLVGLTEQTTWLIADLAAARARGVARIFVFFHHPPYSSGSHGRELPVFYQWCPIFEWFEVDMVFSGHDHHYERSTRVRDFFPNKRGVWYYVVGTGGGSQPPIQVRQPYSRFDAVVPGVLKVEVRGNLLSTQFLEASESNFGGLIDRATYLDGVRTPSLRALRPDPQIGQTWVCVMDVPRGNAYLAFFGTNPGYEMVPGVGVWHIPLSSSILVGSGFSATNRLSVPLRARVPRQAAMIGRDLLFQGMLWRGSEGLRFTSVQAATVR